MSRTGAEMDPAAKLHDDTHPPNPRPLDDEAPLVRCVQHSATLGVTAAEWAEGKVWCAGPRRVAEDVHPVHLHAATRRAAELAGAMAPMVGFPAAWDAAASIASCIEESADWDGVYDTAIKAIAYRVANAATCGESWRDLTQGDASPGDVDSMACAVADTWRRSRVWKVGITNG